MNSIPITLVAKVTFYLFIPTTPTENRSSQEALWGIVYAVSVLPWQL
jgi:hypothetical protein